MRLLHAELQRLLAQRDGSYFIGLPADFYQASFDETTGLLRWQHGLAGDYDLNGDVNLADITPLGNLWGSTVAYGQSNSRAGWVDGGRNGEINLADLTPVGSNFGTRVLGYRVLGAETLDPAHPEDGYRLLAEFPLASATPGWPPTFGYQVPAGVNYIQLAAMNEPEDVLLREPLGKAIPPGDGFVDFTDPRTGDTYRVVAGVVMANCKLALDHPKVLAFIEAEKLVLSESIPEFMYFVAHLPPETTLEDAVGNWPSEYPDVVIAVDPDSLISPH